MLHSNDHSDLVGQCYIISIYAILYVAEIIS